MKQKGQNRLYIEGDLLWTGIRKAASRAEGPILCLVRSGTVKFVTLSGLRMVVSWETPLHRPVVSRLAFLIPPMIAQWLSGEAVRSQAGVEIAIQGKDVVARLSDHLGRYEIHWKSDLASFPAPTEFSELVQVPDTLMEVPYLRVADATHEAVAKLARMEANAQVRWTKLAILIDLDLGRLSINGQEIAGVESSRYYFDPRLVIRALEFIKERSIHVSITPLKGRQRAYLSLLAKQGGWTVHCALLSIGKETQELYPLPPRHGR